MALRRVVQAFTPAVRRFFLRLRAAVRPGRNEADLAREIAAHRALLEDDFVRRGMRADQARLAARRAFGSSALTADLHRDARSFAWIDDARRDVRYAIRTLRRTPGFTVVAVVTLALGIGASTAIFTLIDGVLLQSLPVRDAGGLVLLGDARGAGSAVGLQGGSFTLFSYDLYRHLRGVDAFESLCAMQSNKSRVSVRRSGLTVAEPAWAKLVSGNYFDVLGTRPAIGRLLEPADEAASAPPVAVISFRYWTERLHEDPSAIGSVVRLDRVPVVIVGVAAAEFYGETLEADPPGFWIPLKVDRQLNPAGTLVDVPDQHWLYLMGRPGPNVTRAQARDRLSAALRDWLSTREGASVSSERQAAVAKVHIELTPEESGITRTQRAYSSVLQLLLAISSTVLLIACANIASLLLARGAARQKERSVRLALGASRGRLVRQSLTESLTLALAGGALGIVIAKAGAQVLVALAFSGTEYPPVATSPDVRVLAFAFMVSCAAAVVFGVLPAIRGSVDVVPGMNVISPTLRRSVSRRFGWANALIIGQVALSLVVLAAAAALARSLANLARQPFGFTTERLLVVGVDPARAGYDFNRLGPLYREIDVRLNAIPGVKRAAFSYYSPFNECCWAFSIAVQGDTPRQDDTSAMLNRVSSGYFETLGTKLQRGRTFDERDTPASARVAIVNAAFVRHYFQEADPIGRRFGIGGDVARSDLEIVGVVENAKYDSPRDRPEPMAFLPLLQVYPRQAASDVDHSQFIRTIEVRTTASPTAVARAVRQALAAIDPNLAVLRVDTLTDHVDRALARENVVAVLAGFFGLLALVVTCVGLYGLTAYSVQRRGREIGIRVALGARRATVLGMVIREALLQGAIGLLIGLPSRSAPSD
jgi:macrolide transport system ATP-binding/permease protein